MNDVSAQAPAAHSLAADFALLKAAVREAGTLALGFFGRSPRVRRKSDGSQVSDADLAVDAALREALATARPAYGWLSEESADDLGRLERSRVWIVDPIDGTRAFLAERPDWTIAAGLVKDGRAVLGVVFNPARNEFFAAAEGAGATLNDVPIRTSDQRRLDGAALVASATLLRRRDWPKPWPAVRTAWVNSVAYRLALVAGGRFDATLSLSRKHDWDLAAAHILVQEAGGRLTTHRGHEIVYNRLRPVHDSIVAAGEGLHGLLLERTTALELR